MQKKLSIQDRIKVAITGETKSIIPSLASLDSDSGVPLAHYNTKPEQLRANIGWVYAANSAIVEPTAAVELKLYRKKSDGDREEVHQHEILDLLNSPSFAHDGEALRTLHHTYLNLTGDSYLLMVKGGHPFEVKKGQLPDALQVIPSHSAEFKLGKDRYSDSKIKYGQNEYKITEVIRGFVPDPGNPFYGRSVVSAAAASVDVDQQMQSWNRRTFANNARPGLIFNLQGENIDDDSYERIKQQMQELYTGDGAFKSLVIENGDVKPYMLNHQDLDFLASREFTRDEILAMFKVPTSMLGMSKDYNRANIDGSRYIHMLLNVVPRLRREVHMWNSQLVTKYDPTLELDFENPIPEDVEAKLKAAEAGTNSWLTIDEVRDQYGLEPLKGGLGDQLYVPINTVRLSDVAQGPSKPATAPSSDENADAGSNEDDGEDEAAPEGKKSLPLARN